MENKNIQLVLKNVPQQLLGTTRFVRHFMYGPATKLRRLRTQIKQQRDLASFDLKDDRLIVILADHISLQGLERVTHFLSSLADDLSLEYDGFEIVLGNEIEEKSLPRFERYFSPRSYVRFKLDTERYGYLLYIGGYKMDYVFDCLSLIDDGQTDLLGLDEVPRLYRQPVRAVIDPSQVEYVGHSTRPLPQKISFRMGTDFPTPEEIDEIAKRYGIDREERDSKWPIVREKMYQAGENLRRGLFVEYVANFDPKNKITWTRTGTCSADGTQILPWSAGAFATLDMFRDALLGRPDIFAMNDAVY